MMKYFVCIFVFISLSLNSQVKETTLDATWTFKQKGSEHYYSASIPGTVHTDLVNNALIKNPFFGENEKSVQWVENEDWEYKGVFNCDQLTLQNRFIELSFEGLDTYAKVFLNGTQILEANNMFRIWNVDVKPFLKVGENILQITFESALKKGKAEAAKLNYTLPGDEKVFTRKAQYQYGWDFGPRLGTCGIIKPIKLISWNDLKIVSIRHQIQKLDSTIANIQFITEIQSAKDTACTIGIHSYFQKAKKATSASNNSTRIIYLHKGLNNDTLEYTIQNPHVWQTNGVGDANLYEFDFNIIHKKEVAFLKHLSIGLRTLELVKENDFFGQSFYFKLNGAPVFMKGANYIPQDNFLSKVKSSDYKRIIEMAKEANMNMLRVWGGGVYADDEFYNLCDKNGLLVWQDFMFACAMYPGDSTFVENVTQEITQQVQRLQNHPCIALWSGNNEIDEGWQNWGWQKQYKYSKLDSTKIWKDYIHLFQNLIPAIVKKNSPQIPYWASSPSIGWGHQESLMRGDSHYWGVWWGMEPFDIYNKKIGRFMSEYGFQGMPAMSTFKTFCDTNELMLNSKPLIAHQKHPTGYQTIQTYMERDYKIPTNFNNYIYVSQLLQRDGMKIAIEAHHRAMPYCMGSLFWQLNDCWPGTSWSSIDYNYTPKALYFETKKLFGNLTISIHPNKSKYDIYVVSDKQNSIKGVIDISIKNMKGEILFRQFDTLTIKANESNVCFTLVDSILKGVNKNEVYLSCQLKNTKGELLTRTTYCFVKPKELKLKDPGIKIIYLTNTNFILISSRAFVKDLYLFSNNINLKFSDNFFDVEPNQVLQIKLDSKTLPSYLYNLRIN